MSISDKSLKFHEEHRGKVALQPKVPLNDREDLIMAYTPGVAAPCKSIAENPDNLYKYTSKSNSVAVVTDGSAVLGLGNIGAAASLPVMEGKCLLFKRFADIDAFPVCIDTQNTDEFIQTVKHIVAPYGGINLEDISSPRCFQIEKILQEELDIPVFHDDQHGTAIAVLAALINALKVVNKSIENCKIVISGAGAAGIATSDLLYGFGAQNIILSDSHGALTLDRKDIPNIPHKLELAKRTNPQNESGDLSTLLKNADVFIGVSAPGIVTKEMVETMADDSIVFAMANPVPEIMPDEAFSGGAKIYGSGRSDFDNQINNLLAFPGIFRGALDNRVRDITSKMHYASAKAIADLVPNPSVNKIIPDIFDEGVSDVIADAIKICQKNK